MDIRYAVHPEQMKTLDTQKMREQFLVENLFARDRLNMVYSHIDRIIVGGISPGKGAVDLKVTKELGVDSFNFGNQFQRAGSTFACLELVPQGTLSGSGRVVQRCFVPKQEKPLPFCRPGQDLFG